VPGWPRCWRSEPGAAQFGTRFLASEAAVLGASFDDTPTVGHGLGVIRALANKFTAQMAELEEAAAALDARRAVFGAATLKDAALHGDVIGGKLEACQSAGLIDAVLPAAEIVARIVVEYAEARDRLMPPRRG
jgi:enoyl-[acyl-carrier protein] reductase II